MNQSYAAGEETRPGRLKIFFGYAPDVGKTRAMLEAAKQERARGSDVVLGCLERDVSPGVRQLARGFSCLPSSASGELDLNAALERKPALLLVDQLAHQNAAGCRHLKRHQDVQELLRAGISVYTTLSVQSLESLNDVISAVTGLVVGERVPDQIFDAADQVEFIDLDPDDLLNRIEEEHPGNARFFSRKSLVSLREIALRRTADRTGKKEEHTGALTDAGEHLLICLSSAPSNAKVIRTAARMAEAFHSGFTALFVETPDGKELQGENGRRLQANLKLAEDLGARIATAYGEDVAFQIAEYARVSGVSKIVVGRTNHKRQPFHKSSLTDRLTRLAPNMDIYIIPDNQPPYQPERPRRTGVEHFSFRNFVKAMSLVALSTMVGGVFYVLHFDESNIITIYILGVLLAALWTESWLYSGIASLVSVLAFNFFFTVPRFTLTATASYYPLTFLIMLAAGFITSSLTTRVQTQARQAAQQAHRTEVLLETSQKLQQAEGNKGILRAAAVQLRKLLGRTVLFYPTENGQLQAPVILPAPPDTDLSSLTTEEEQAVARWVLQNNKRAGAGTSTLPTARCLYLAVRGGQSGVLAVAAIVMDRGGLDAFEKNLTLAMLDECGMLMERTLLHEAKRRVEQEVQQESLRANLLRSISHDLRTPLTSITGNAGILMENSGILDDQKRMQLYESIYDDSMWLYNLVENLLSVTRIENGSMGIRTEPELLDDVFREALHHLDRKASEHRIAISLSDDLLMADMNARLILQVLINLLNNAVKYTPAGSLITLSGFREGEQVVVEVADNGPGIPDSDKPRLFDMFYTAGNTRGDGRRGLGLGLALCKSIISAHGGVISVADNHPQGTVFRFTLSSAEVKAL
ncbi:MAG: sensor histidine kinase KdpD [Oscillospiraceae bacterium]|nr:sensor histidine kinase KdpD [Oscillospiraceae bacterium]